MKLADLKNKKIQIVGLSGAEGASTALFLLELGCKNLVGHDYKTKAEFVASLANYNRAWSKARVREIVKLFQTIGYSTEKIIKIHYQDTYLAGINEAEIIFATSSWFRYKVNEPLYLVNKQKTKFWCWYNLLLEFFPGFLIGVTGTAGKGMVTNLLYHLIKKPNVYLFGDSWRELNLKEVFGKKNCTIIGEINNRVLTFAPASAKSPNLVIITNVVKNHLDDHHDRFIEYWESKRNLVLFQKKSGRALLNADDPWVTKMQKFGHGKKLWYGKKGREAKVTKDAIVIKFGIKQEEYKLADMPFIGQHFYSNAASSILAARLLGVSEKQVRERLKTFPVREGRMQKLGVKKELTFIDDGAATRPIATLKAVEALPIGKTWLLLQGSRKYESTDEFIKMVKMIGKKKVKLVLMSGGVEKIVQPLFKKYAAKVKFKVCSSMTQSFQQAVAGAKTGDCVLLSPSCESFGEFKDYRERSALFHKLYQDLSSRA
ncbi:MAG: Mur ligase family protein [Candidatus Komeilibacteria bacterium]|nr:Mur ligase family protein [Candidatus Komeilibacteria bacterium]